MYKLFFITIIVLFVAGYSYNNTPKTGLIINRLAYDFSEYFQTWLFPGSHIEVSGFVCLEKLNPVLMPQPKGITYDTLGNMYFTGDGYGGKALIQMFKYFGNFK